MPQWSEDNWKILAGLAFFLLTIRSMEGSIAEMSGRRFKLFLKKETGNRVKAAATSAMITSVLQSSSLVNLLIIDMVGAGIVNLEGGLALNLGANLGTTVNSWLVVIMGFNLDMESWIIPATGISGIVMGLSRSGTRVHQLSRFLFSLSLLLFSLNFIKAGMGTLITHSSLYLIKGSFTFLLFGLIITSFVQASSIVMVLALSALYANVIPLESACAIVLGGEIGTTLKMFVAARGTSATKKRLALGNFLFNLVAALIVLPIIAFVATGVMQLTGGKDQLIALVLFQTLFNIFSLLLFLPLLNRISRLLSRCFLSTGNITHFLHGRIPADNAEALRGMEDETRNFIKQAALYMVSMFGSPGNEQAKSVRPKKENDQQPEELYLSLKQLYGWIHRYSLRFKRINKHAEAGARIDQLVSAVRNTMYAAKSIRNITDDIRQFRNSSNDIKYNFYLDISRRVPDFCRLLTTLADDTKSATAAHTNALVKIYADMSDAYKASLQTLYGDTMTDGISDVEISTLMNCNREIYSSFKSLFYGVMEFILSPADTTRFEQQPGFIR